MPCSVYPDTERFRMPHPSRKQRTSHHNVCTSGDRFSHITRKLNTAIRNNVGTPFMRDFCAPFDGRKLWNTDSSNNARSANGSGSNSNLDGIGTCIETGGRRIGCRNVTQNKIYVRPACLRLFGGL